MQKIVAALLGLTKAATPGPFPSIVFPKFDTLAAPQVADLDSDNVKSDYLLNKSAGTGAGPVRAYRNDVSVFPTQNVVKPTANGLGSVAAQTTTRTFWQTTTTQLGTQAAKATDATAANAFAGGVTW